MILSFKEKFPDGTPTYFIERIWNGIFNEGRKANSVLARLYQIGDYSDYLAAYEAKFGRQWDGCSAAASGQICTDTKLHTIRAGQRWKAGDTIHLCVNARSKNYFQFAPVMKVVSVQKIEIEYTREDVFPTIFLDNIGQRYKHVYFYPFNRTSLDTLAKNDGFKDFEEFAAFFAPLRYKFARKGYKDFTGQIIHWTDLKY
jgi:hypothetical protein